MRLLKKRLLTLVMIVSLLIASIMPVTAQDLSGDLVYVSTTGDNVNNNGNQDNPYQTIQYAMDNVGESGTIYIEAGIYYENLTISKSVTLIGDNQETTIIDGSGSNRVILIDDEEDMTDIVVSIQGLTIQNGRALNGADGVDGANGEGTINSDGENGSTGKAGGDGGGIYNEEELSIKNCTIKNNTTGTGGTGGTGGMYNVDYESYVDWSCAGVGGIGGMGGNGGGIYNAGVLTIQNTEITNNTAGNGGTGGNGGYGANGIYASGAAGGMGGSGGGIYNIGDLSVMYSTISNNSAGTGGTGGLGNGDTTSKFGFNGANGGSGGNGGGIATIGTTEVVSCNITGNSSGTGGNGRNGTSSLSGSSSSQGDGGNGGSGGKGGAIYSNSTISSVINISFIRNNTVGLGGDGGSGGSIMYTDYVGDDGASGSSGMAKSIYNNGEELVAQNNWWGQNSGVITGENVGVTPIEKYMKIEVTYSSLSLLLEDEIDVIVQFTNNVGDDLRDHIMDGIGINFTANNGSIEGVANTINGVVTSIYKGKVSGMDTITVNLDDEIISRSIVIESMKITATLPVGIVDLYYEGYLDSSGTSEPLTWGITGLPTGLVLDSDTGVISGTPTEVGEYTLKISLVDSRGVSASTVAVITIYKGSGNGAFLINPVTDSAYTSSEVDNLPMMTVNSGALDFIYFKVEIREIFGHEGDETVVFIQYRNDGQIGMSVFVSDLETGDNIGAGFSVEAGDVIKVFVVDNLSHDAGIISTIL
jgi:hypothetical protein